MSETDANPPRVIRFGLYEVDLAAHELRRDGLTIKLQARPFEVLTILLERAGEVISREEFRRRIWSADIFINFDTSLNTTINKLRQALDDDAENPRFIATAGRRGYRFIAPVTVFSSGALTPASTSEALSSPSANASNGAARRSSWQYAVVGIASFVVISILAFIALRPEPVPRVTNVVQISQDGLLDPWGRLTTDGARVFFLDRIGGHWNLMQVPASGGEARSFPEPSQNIRIVDVSPDRALLVTFAFSGRSTDLPLSLTPVVGGSSRRVGNIIADDAVFTPDGERLVFNRPDGIYLSERDGSHVEKLVALPGRSEDPQWSRDGRRLRFTLHDRNTNGASIWEVSADGSNLHEVNLNLPHPGDTCCGRWSVDGRYFFFSFVRDRLQSIWAIRDGVRSWRLKPSRPVQLTLGPNNYGGLITDANPARVFVWSGVEQREMDRYDPHSGRVQPVLAGFRAPYLDTSPDSRWLSFATGGELWRSRADGSERQPLVSGFPAIDRVVWSPDASHILFQTPEGIDSGKFFLVSVDGGPATEISLKSGHAEPSWFPDGKAVVFAKWAGDRDVTRAESGIFLLDLRTSLVTKIPGSEGLIHPSISPDRRFLAAVTNFDMDPTQPTRVKLFDMRTHEWVEIAHGTLVNSVQWSADSKFFYYQDILGEGQPAFRFSLAANRSEPFVDFSSLLGDGYARCSLRRVAPDGSLIVSLMRNEVNVYRMDLNLP
jgi:DNA-binding winged helix-turn-helix (wHTH) protein/Tol biopolymer transport system component